ncbi:hypothetical protein G7046_g3139 [Stylonectria norvegica]|nr:hypothetical protein G7046_g3139 [Stylonectria norvegica]
MSPTLFEIISNQRLDLPVPDAAVVTGTTCIVTGSNHGLGLECVQHLVRLGAKRVIIAVRYLSSGETARKAIEAKTGRSGVLEVWHLDLASYDSVKKFAKKASEELETIDIIIQNATAALEDFTTAEGLETTLTVNIVSSFLLALLILPKLKASARHTKRPPHLAFVTSDLGFFQQVEFEKLCNDESADVLENLSIKGKWKMANNARYGLSKLLVTILVRELSSRLDFTKNGVVINAANPGLCNTGLARYTSTLNRVRVRTLNALIGRTPEMGSRTLLHAGTAGIDSHGNYLSDAQIKPSYVADWASNESAMKFQKRLWGQLAQRLQSIQPGCLEVLD